MDIEEKLRGTFNLKFSNNISAIQWRDECFYGDDENNQGNCVINYTQNMSMVDKVDMQISTVECVRKSVKWYKKPFFHLMDLSVHNSYYLYLVYLSVYFIIVLKFSFNIFSNQIITYIIAPFLVLKITSSLQIYVE